jgi:hypothetical protein
MKNNLIIGSILIVVFATFGYFWGTKEVKVSPIVETNQTVKSENKQEETGINSSVDSELAATIQAEGAIDSQIDELELATF